MGANTANALLFLITTLFDLLIWAFLLRIVLQWVRADFYNPVSQAIWKLTRFPTDALRPYLPQARGFNVAAALTALLIAVVYIYVIIGLLNFSGISPPLVLWFALLKLLVLTVNLFTLTLFVQAVLSWLGPGVNNPASNILWSMNEPLLRPVRRLIPPLSGLDLSPLVLILLLQVLNRLLPLPGAFR
ncbi:MAG TPA: YggT family protein [Solimonas sp.]